MPVDTTQFTYVGQDGTEITAFRWAAPGTPRAIIQLAHGAGEHSLRYLEPLTPLIESGYTIYSADHRGHGATAGAPDRLGDFGPGGAAAAVDDMAVLTRRIREEHPGVPLVLLGHSMGASFSQVYLTEHHALLDALVLSGTAANWLPRGERGPNSGYENPRTDYDWLSRDEAEVDKYIADPLCKIRFTPESRASFTSLGQRTADPGYLQQVRKDLPIYVFVGDEDPVNLGMTRLTPLIDRYQEAGLTDVTLKVYPGGRHEMLNETNRAEVVADLQAWLDSHLA